MEFDKFYKTENRMILYKDDYFINFDVMKVMKKIS